MSTRRLSVLGLLLATPALAADASSPGPLSALQACRALTDGAARVECYDKAVDALTTAAAHHDVEVLDRQDIHRTRRSLFGFSLPNIGFLATRPGNAEDKREEARLETKVLTVRKLAGDKFRFTVEGGGVWETVESDFSFDDPVPGHNVVIDKGSLGGYFVSTGRGKRVAARRIG